MKTLFLAALLLLQLLSFKEVSLPVEAQLPATEAVATGPDLMTLVNDAQIIVTGNVVGLQYERNNETGVIYTNTTISVQNYLKGGNGETTIKVKTLGGTVGDLRFWVSETPEFELGETTLLFLKKGDAFVPDNLTPIWRGKYEIQNGILQETGKALSDITQKIQAISQGEKIDEPMIWDESESEVAEQKHLEYWYDGTHWLGPSPMGEPYYIYENTADCTGEGAAVKAAAQTWSDVTGANFNFVYGGPTTRSVPLYDGYNVIRWDNLGASSALAYASIWSYIPSGQIVETDMVFNDYHNWSASDPCPRYYFDVQNIASHEFGHWLELGDLYGTEDAEKTMYGYSRYEEIKKRTLHEDDIAGIRYIYPGSPPVGWSVSPDNLCTGPSIWQQFTATYTDPDGWQNIRYADFLINTTSTTTSQCIYARYDRQNNQFFLRRPDGLYWMGGITPGQQVIISNIYGQLDVGRSSVSGTGETLTVIWMLKPTTKNTGKFHNLYLASEDLSGAREGWYDKGDWIINQRPSWLAPPTIINTAIPVSGTHTFDPRYKDNDGRRNLDELYFLITNQTPGSAGSLRNSVYLKYDQSENKMYLRDVNDTAWLPAGGFTPATDLRVENSLVTVFGLWTRVGVYDAKTLTIRWPLQFKTAFRGTHNVYMRAIDAFPNCNGDTGWKYKGWINIY